MLHIDSRSSLFNMTDPNYLLAGGEIPSERKLGSGYCCSCLCPFHLFYNLLNPQIKEKSDFFLSFFVTIFYD